MTQEIKKPDQDDLVTIESVEQFGVLVHTWHERQVATVRHLMEVPEGVEISIGSHEADAVKTVLTGDLCKGYRLGMDLALGYLGVLPFVHIDEPAQVPDESTVTEEVSPEAAVVH